MKHKLTYKLEINGNELYSTDDIDDFNKVCKEMTYRQTGRTTRMLFQALGSDNPNIYILGFNRQSSKMLFKMFCDILTKLGFHFEHSVSEQRVTNSGRTFRFLADERFNETSYQKTLPVGYKVYRDEK